MNIFEKIIKDREIRKISPRFKAEMYREKKNLKIFLRNLVKKLMILDTIFC